MARNQILIRARPEQVFAVLDDGWAYERWVVGARRIRAVDPHWPAPGARIHHTFGAGPLIIRDTTVLLERRPPDLLVLKARARPLGVARVEFRLSAEHGGTRLVMDERPVSAIVRVAWRPVLDPLTHVRNESCLRKLKALVEERV